MGRFRINFQKKTERVHKLEAVIYSLYRFSRPTEKKISAMSFLGVTLIYLIGVLSVSLFSADRLILFAVYPMVQSEISGIGFMKIFLKSLWVLPLIVLIGIFNPMVEHAPAFYIGPYPVSAGWLSFFSIVLRGMMAVQAVLILTMSAGFYDMCAAMRRVGCPKILVTQLQFTYRYLVVICEETLWMDKARKSRGFGKKSYPFRMWTRMIGQLLLRSHERASRIHQAMLSRGFTGVMPDFTRTEMKISLMFFLIWTALIAILRFAPLPFSFLSI